MLTRRYCLHILRGLSFLTVLWLLPVLPIPAQQGVEVLPTDGTEVLKKEYSEYRSVLPDLFRGNIRLGEERYNKAIDFEARYDLYRFTWNENWLEPGKMDKLFKDFENDVSNLAKFNNNETRAVAKVFGKQLAIRGKEVLQTTKPIARFNAARALEHWTGDRKMAATESGQDDLVDVAVEFLNDPKETNDGVKLFLLRTLRNILAQPQPKPRLLTKEREDKAILAALAFVERKANFTPTAPREEVEGFRSLRREGFRALSYARQPSVGDKGKPALVLLRAAVRDGFVPEVRLDEQIEAALGVTRLQPQLDPSYNKDYAAYMLGQFVVEMGQDYQKDEKGPLKLVPFRVYAARFLDGLDAMKADSKDKPVDDYCRQAVAECAKVLSKMETKNAAAPFDLSRWLERQQPPNKQLFKNAADSTVKPGANKQLEATMGG